jgi:hypothetical protein
MSMPTYDDYDDIPIQYTMIHKSSHKWESPTVKKLKQQPNIIQQIQQTQNMLKILAQNAYDSNDTAYRASEHYYNSLNGIFTSYMPEKSNNDIDLVIYSIRNIQTRDNPYGERTKIIMEDLISKWMLGKNNYSVEYMNALYKRKSILV